MAITFAQSAKAIAATTASKDFSACNGTGLFVACIGIFDNATFSDSSSNTWTEASFGLTDGASGGSIKTMYCVNPTATSSHTFSYSGSFYSMAVLGFANVLGLDAGKETETNGPTATQPGSLTPSVDNCVFVAGYSGDVVTPSINGSFSGTEVFNNYGAGVNYSSAIAYFIQGTAAAQNPTWTPTSGGGGCTMLVFKPSAGGGGGTVLKPFGFTLMGIQ